MAEELKNGNGSGVPLLHQYDSRWKTHPYNNGTVGSSGCGPTCFAMIARWYGIDITPADAADFAAKGGYHTAEGTSYTFFLEAAKNWGFEMKQGTREEVEKALKDDIPCIGAHGPGLFTNSGHFVVYAKLTDKGLLVNDPNCNGGGPNDRGDDYAYDLNQVLTENGTPNFIAFIPTTSHAGKNALLNDQSTGEHGTGSGLINAVNIGQKSGYKGFRVIPRGPETVQIIRLPDRKTYCEPIYPDYITVSDTVPRWALDASIEQKNTEIAQKEGKGMPNGDAKEKAPNGMNYYENDIKYLIENAHMTREQAIQTLEKEEKYTRKVSQNSDGTFSVVDDGTAKK